MGEKKQNYINVPIDVMHKAVQKSINNNEAVWVGVDFDKYRSHEHGYLDKKGFNYKDIFGSDNILEKCDSLNYRQSRPDHAVTIRGYNFGKGKTNGYLVENSWGEKNGFKGTYYMAKEWFDNYVYEVVIDKKCVNKSVLNVLKKKPITLPYWSPFGSLLNNKN